MLDFAPSVGSTCFLKGDRNGWDQEFDGEPLRTRHKDRVKSESGLRLGHGRGCQLRACSQASRADKQGFSLHVPVRCDAHERQRLERLCRDITRPALANERVQCNSAGQAALKLKRSWRDGATHLVLSPLEFMQRLGALVPQPRLHLIRFYGVLAPNAKLRSLMVLAGPEEATGESEHIATESGCAHGRPARISWARLLSRRGRPSC